MLGRVGRMLPLFISSRAGPWLGLSVCSERSTHTSSMQRAKRGNSSLTGTPLCPRGANSNGEGSNPAVRRSVRSCTALGRWPAYFFKSGLGSSRSPENGPPFMNKWMTRLAFAATCGRGAAWLGDASNCASASEPRPPPMAWIICRRSTARGVVSFMVKVPHG